MAIQSKTDLTPGSGFGFVSGLNATSIHLHPPPSQLHIQSNSVRNVSRNQFEILSVVGASFVGFAIADGTEGGASPPPPFLHPSPPPPPLYWG